MNRRLARFLNSFAKRLGAFLAAMILLAGIGTAAYRALAGSSTISAPNIQEQQYRQPQAVNNGLVAWWKLDGDATDALGTSNGTLQNFKGGTVDGYNAGKFGKSLQFDGGTDAVLAGKASAINNLTQYSQSFWFYEVASTSTAAYLIEKNGNKRAFLNTNRSITVTNTFSTQYGQWGTAASTYDYLTWNHVVITYDGSSTANVPIIYVNGVSKSVSASQAPIGTLSADAANDLYLGNNSSYNRGFNGYLDDVRLYNRILSASEVATLYSGSQPAAYDQRIKAYFPFDETGGYRTINKPGLANTATLQNFNFNGSTSDWTSGQYGNALNFDGTNDRVLTGNITTTPAMTVSVWINIDASQSAFGRIVGGVNTIALGLNSNASASINTGNGSAYCGGGPGYTYTRSVWTHVVFTMNGTATVLYINGSQVGTATASCTMPVASYANAIGALPAGSQNFQGKIDDVRIYDYALSAAEVSTLYGTGSLPSDSTNRLTNWWKLDEGSGTTTKDSSVITAGAGTLTNFSFDSTDGPVPGVFGNGLDFTGGASPGWVAVPDLGLTKGSLDFWINPSTASGNQWIFAQSSGSTWNGSIAFTTASGESGSLWVYDGSAFQRLCDAGGLVANKWQHVAVNYNGATASMYINGVLQPYAPATTFAFSGVGASIAGKAGNSNGSAFSGALDDFRIYSLPQSAQDIAEHAKLGL